MSNAEVMSELEWRASGCLGDQPVSMTLDGIAPPRQPFVALRLAVLPDESIAHYRGRLSAQVRAGRLAPGQVGIAIEGTGQTYAGRRWARSGTLGEGDVAVIVCSEAGPRGVELRREAAEALARAGWSVTLDGRRLPAAGDLLYVLSGPLEGKRVQVVGAPFAGQVGVRGGDGVGTAQLRVEHLVDRVVRRNRPMTRLNRPGTPLDEVTASIMRRALGPGWAVERPPGGRPALVKRGPNGVEGQIDQWDPDEGTRRQVRRARGW